MTGTDIHTLSASALLDAYAGGRLSPVEATAATFARIERYDRTINAFCLFDAQRALDQARASEQRWAAGTPQGGLDGVPVAIKDLFATRGWPTLRGSGMVDPRGPWPDDAPAVASLRAQGAVLVGKTTTPEFGWKGVTDSVLTGITRNPWDPDCTAGGSSGGSAAALAAGMVPLALGTDGGGSIRIPSAFCGLPGLKPTFGRVPLWPPSPFGALAHAGPMARTVADLALLLDAIAAPDPRDWTALPAARSSFEDALHDGVRGLRIAFSPDLGHVAVDSEVAKLVAAVAATFETLGAHVERVDPELADSLPTFEALWSAGAATLASELPDGAPLDPGLRTLATRGANQSLAEYLAAQRQRDQLGLAMSLFHTEWDLLLTPSVPIAAFAAGRETPEGWGAANWTSWTPFTYPFNLTQQPAVTFPCGFTAAGLPVGAQLVGARYRDALVLCAAFAYESAQPQPTIAPDPPNQEDTPPWSATSRSH